MSISAIKIGIFVTWLIAVGLVAAALAITSTFGWLLATGVAVVPALVARHFWRVPRQTMSESIQAARR